MELLLSAASVSLSMDTVLAVFIGCVIGVVFGTIPGLTVTVVMALVMPASFSLPPQPGIGLLIGTYIGGMTAGAVTAVLIGIPGTPSSAATVLDGYPLGRQGRASITLGMTVVASGFGGLISLLVMIVSVDLVAGAAIYFGPAEIFTLLLFGLSTICGLSGGSLLRGLIAGVLGLMVMTIGVDALEGVQRLTFGTVTLQQGVHLLVAMVGIFAVPQVIDAFVQYYRKEGGIDIKTQVGRALPSLREVGTHFWLMVRCSLLGTGVGAIPGTAGPVASFLAYAHAKRSSKTPERFGKGEMAGVVAPESANNAVAGGAMIPLLSLGIPGDPGTAILLSGLLIHGIIPGPMLFVQNPGQIYQIYIVFIVCYIFTLALQYLGIRFFVQLLRIPPHLLAVGIVVMCGYGAYSIRNSPFDVYSVAILGVAAYGLMRAKIPMTPVILGIVLGAPLEREFRTAMILSGGDVSVFWSSIPAAVFLGLAVIVVVSQVRRSTRGLTAKIRERRELRNAEVRSGEK